MLPSNPPEIIEVRPKIFDHCGICLVAKAIHGILTNSQYWSGKYIPPGGSLTAEVRCAFTSNNPSGVIVSGKIRPTQVDNNPRFWAFLPRVKNEKCPVMEVRRRLVSLIKKAPLGVQT